MRNQIQLKTKLSLNANNGGEYGDHDWQESDDSKLAGDSRRFRIAENQTDFEIDLTDMVSVGAYLAVRVDQDVGIKLNDVGNTSLSLRKVSESRYGYLVVTMDVTKLFVTTGATETIVDVAFTGE